jgi:hypothetical protein
MLDELLKQHTLFKEDLNELLDSFGEHELHIDFDENEFNDFLERIFLIRRALGLVFTKTDVFTTKAGFHIYLYCANPLSRYDIILVQALLGDDYKHVLSNYQLLKANVPLNHWNVLFKEKFFLNRFGLSYQASAEQFNQQLTDKLYTYITCQLPEAHDAT